MITKYERLSHERKQLQLNGQAPEWLTTAGYQLLTEKNYLDVGETPIDMYRRLDYREGELTEVDIQESLGYG